MNRPARAAATAIIVTMLVFAIASLLVGMKIGLFLAGALVIGGSVGFVLAGIKRGAREYVEPDYDGAL
jgi:hypothetical protein